MKLKNVWNKKYRWQWKKCGWHLKSLLIIKIQMDYKLKYRLALMELKQI